MIVKININGVTRDMTPEETAEMQRLQAQIPDPEPTPEQRMDEIENALIELAAMLAGGDE